MTKRCLTALAATVCVLFTWSDGLLSASQQKIRVVAWNVKFGDLTTPQQAAEALRPLAPDLVMLQEVPGEGWSTEFGDALGLPYAVRSQQSSAHHADKYTSLVSRVPLVAVCEYPLRHDKGWSPASVLRAVGIFEGRPVSVYSLHIANAKEEKGHIWELAHSILPADTTQNVILGGDFNHVPDTAGLNAVESAGYRLVWRDLDGDIRDLSSVVKAQNYWLIDHLLYKEKGGIATSHSRVVKLPRPLSDHHPIQTDILFAPTDRQNTEYDNSCQTESFPQKRR